MRERVLLSSGRIVKGECTLFLTPLTHFFVKWTEDPVEFINPKTLVSHGDTRE